MESDIASRGNVRQFVLFDSHMQGVPYAQRHIEGPADLVEASVSDDVRQGWVWDAIKQFWEDYLGRFASLINGRPRLPAVSH